MKEKVVSDKWQITLDQIIAVDLVLGVFIDAMNEGGQGQLPFRKANEDDSTFHSNDHRQHSETRLHFTVHVNLSGTPRNSTIVTVCPPTNHKPGGE